MKRYYRIRFILAAMLSFLLLILLTVGGIWLYSYLKMEKNTDGFLESRLNADRENPPAFTQDASPPMFGYTPGRRQYPSGFYDLMLSDQGELLSVTQRGIPEEITPDLQRSITDAILRNKQKGKISSYKYQVSRNEDGTYRMILLDISIQLQSLYEILKSAALVALGMLGVLFIILLPVSSRIAGAFVRNSEKQKQFITDAGHDLKTPVAIARANLDVLELTQGKNKWSGNIRSQVNRMEELVQQLISMARLDENMDRKSFVRLAFSTILSEVWQEYLPAMEQKNLICSDSVEPDLSLSGMEDAIRQMMRLLLDNAVRYTQDGGEVRLTASRDRKKIRVRLANIVSALPQQPPEELTGRFVRGDTARTQEKGGAGIGLSAVRRIVEMHGGKLEIRYEEGNVFCVLIDFPG